MSPEFFPESDDGGISLNNEKDDLFDQEDIDEFIDVVMQKPCFDPISCGVSEEAIMQGLINGTPFCSNIANCQRYKKNT